MVFISKQLAATGWETGGLLYANSLSDLAGALWTVGKPRPALAAERRAVEIRQRLAETNQVDESFYAASLINIGQFMAGSGQWREGLEVLQQAVELGNGWPGQIRPDTNRGMPPR